MGIEINELEEIFWEDGRYINSQEEEVNPKPFGRSRILNDRMLRIFKRGYSNDKEFSEEVNAYSKGDCAVDSSHFPIQFYKI